MSAAEQITAFESEIAALVEKYRAEFDLPYASAIGVLHMQAGRLEREAEEGE